MLDFIISNLATIIISAALVAVVALITANLIKKKKTGKSDGCGCGCSSCPSSYMCHKE